MAKKRLDLLLVEKGEKKQEQLLWRAGYKLMAK
jgi:hypothetical protein